MDAEIIIVSGLPRSGTSLMMQMLASGGLQPVTDHVRTPDTDNPRGYYELEKVKKIKDDASWLPETRGKVFKLVSQLLFDLPPNERYRIIFMERDLDEMLVSQEAMLRRRERAAAPREDIKRASRNTSIGCATGCPNNRTWQSSTSSTPTSLTGPRNSRGALASSWAAGPIRRRWQPRWTPALYRNRKPAGGAS